MNAIEWRPIPGYEGLYEASSDGQVRSLPRTDRLGRTVNGCTLSQNRIHPAGYPMVRLWRDGKERGNYVYRLVAAAFLGPRPDGMETRHLDGNPANSRLDNLTYGTHSENMQDQLRHGHHHQANKTHCPEGHLLSGSNLFVNRRGARMCRTCINAQRVRRTR